MDCIFCKIAKGEASAFLEGETEGVAAFRSIDPVSETHILIVPKKHISTFVGIHEKDKDLFFEMIEVAQKIISDKGLVDGYKLIINGGKYQSVPHLHWHLLAGKLEDEDDILGKT